MKKTNMIKTNKNRIKKHITFIYSDSIQKQVAEMIASEAKKRGYRTKLSDKKDVKCEIGWYCDHVNLPQFSKFSIIMLHDITQQYGNWPDIWMREPWNKYDIGFLPNKIWVDNWKQCSQYYYANPRKGMYLSGWPKADRVSAHLSEEKRRAFAESVGIDVSKPTILYAPAWENDNKQDEFVQAMLPLDVNIIVKQAPWPDSYVEQLANIKEMYELHKDNPRIIQLEPKVNILDVIMISDVLVSEESSTMCEAVMMGKPAVSVTDWLIPDVTPSRYPSDDYDFVIKTTKGEISNCISDVIENYESYQAEAQEYSDNHFSNVGHCIPIMLDVLDSFVEKKKCAVKRLRPQKRKPLGLKRRIEHAYHVILRETRWNYCERNPIMSALLDMYCRIRKIER